MTTPINRRAFLQQAGAVSIGFAGLGAFLGGGTRLAAALTGDAADGVGFGPLLPDAKKIVELPRGFSYQIVSRFRETMDDGFTVPSKHDGMAAFPGPDGLTIVVRNHEVGSGATNLEGPYGAAGKLRSKLPADRIYDAGPGDARPLLGGTTTFVYDTEKKKLVRHFLSLTGTIRNCAGGPTPWGSWVTCEETNETIGKRCAKDHGYCFEVPATAEPAVADPVPLKAMGRFNHEAIAVDPASGCVYLTEDRHDGLLYRFLPAVPGKLARGGKLQALAIVGQDGHDLRNWVGAKVALREPLAVRWIDLEGIDAPEDDLRIRGHAAGAALFARGEGIWFGGGAIYIACTNGGKKRRGQIYRYVPSAHEGKAGEASKPGELDLFAEPNDDDLLDNADNICVAPWGDVIVCEDGSGEQFVVGITPNGDVYKLARNAGNQSEFAGGCFSPDGTTFFVNVQKTGLTLAITGPWKEAAAAAAKPPLRKGKAKLY